MDRLGDPEWRMMRRRSALRAKKSGKALSMNRFLAALTLAAFASQNANAQGNGPQLYATCVGVEKNSAKDQICNLYLSGLSEGIFVGSRVAEAGFRSCLPKANPLNVQQVREIVEKFLRERPEKINLQASTLVFEALITAFPCKKAESQ